MAIVGAGLTGLWTAYYLRRADPSLRIVVLEAEVAGFGASGRNGGWCSALFPTSWERLVADSSEDGALRLHRAMQETVREVGRAVEAEGIDAHYHRGGTVTLARIPRRSSRGSARRSRPLTPAGSPRRTSGCSSADEASGDARATLVLGGSFTPHCAVVHPSRLVRGLARVVEASGVPVYEQTRCASIAPGRVETDAGTVRAEVVVRATEGYTPRLPGLRRAVVPVYSLMVATEPLSDDPLGLHRAGGPPVVLRRPPPDHLRPAHGRRPAGLRRSRSAVPLRLPHPPVVRPASRGSSRTCAPRSAQMLPQLARRRVHPPVGRLPRHRPGLGRVGRAGP